MQDVLQAQICSTLRRMKTSVQARLDEESAAALESLTKSLGMTPSQVIRTSLRLMVQQQSSLPPRKIIGQGEFDSGIPDLATNKKYLKTLGQHSGLDADPRRKSKSLREESIA